MKRSVPVILLLLAVLVLGSCADPENPQGGDEAYGAIPYVAYYQGFTFYPDGYGKLSYVTYYPNNIASEGYKAWATNSDGAYYNNITWTFTGPTSPDSTGTATLRFDYATGDYEIYTLHNMKPPSGYRGNYYYEYEGYTGGTTYTYDGSWNLDEDLNSTHGLIVIWMKNTASYSMDVYVDNVLKATLYSDQCCVLKVPYGDYTVRYVFSTGEPQEKTVTIGYNNWYYQSWY
jgi:hypothetical protein